MKMGSSQAQPALPHMCKESGCCTKTVHEVLALSQIGWKENSRKTAGWPFTVRLYCRQSVDHNVLGAV